MKRSTKILAYWAGINLLFGLSFLLPHKEISVAGILSSSIQLLLLVISLYIIHHEPIRKNKYIFVNFAIFFGLSILAHAYNFVGTLIFVDEPFARLFIYQYVFVGAYFLLLSLSIVYLTVDLLFRDFKVFQKYAIALVIVCSFFAYYFYPFLVDPKHTHHTSDVLNWKELDKSYRNFMNLHGVQPTPEQLAETTDLQTWRDGVATGTLYPTERLRRVEELFPYLYGENFIVLVFRPLHMVTIHMCVLSIGFILLFFGYQYMKDPPQGAYIEKITFLFLIFCSLEILHAWSFVKIIEWETFSYFASIGQFVSIGVLLLVALYFALRLRFITSVKGEFYEHELAFSPTAVSRWRDSVDNIVIEKFFNRKRVLGRLFIDSSRH